MVQRLSRKERRRWRMDYKRDVPRDVRRRAARERSRERRAKLRQRVAVSHYERERNGQTEHVRDYDQERSMNAPSAPSFTALGRDQERGVEPTMFWAGKTHEWHLRKYPHPGKFEGEAMIASYIWDIASSFGDYVGSEPEMGWTASQVDLGPDAVNDLEYAAKEAGDPPLTEDEKDFIRHMAGAIAEENDVGFVSVEFFETKDEYDKKWKEYEDAESEFYEEQEEAEGGD